MATSWEFSNTVVATMNNDVDVKGRIAKPQELTHALASMTSEIVGSLYSPLKAKHTKFQEILFDLSKATGVGLKDVENSLTESLEQSCDLARDYGLDRKKLMPVVIETEEDIRDKLARQISYYVSSKIPGNSALEKRQQEKQSHKAATGSEINSTPERENSTSLKVSDSFNPELQLQYIQEITSLITESAKLNTVLVKVLQGIHEAIGFERVLLCLLTPDRKRYVGRITIGSDEEKMKAFFNRSVDVKNDIFSKVAIDGVDIVVEDVNDNRWDELIVSTYKKEVEGTSFILSALRAGIKPLGFIYADTGNTQETLSGMQHRGFVQFVAQARLALQTCR